MTKYFLGAPHIVPQHSETMKILIYKYLGRSHLEKKTNFIVFPLFTGMMHIEHIEYFQIY